MSTAANPLLYGRSDEPFDLATWSNPSSEYRGAPFWSWNNKLDGPKLVRQLGFMKDKMGMGGAYMHPRTGLDTEYMGEEYLDIMAECVDFCRKNGMFACLYDEDRWPSGAAGGLVTRKNPDFRQMHLLVTTYPYGQLPEHLTVKNPSKGQVQRSENGKLLATFDVEIDSDGLAKYGRLAEGQTGKHQTFFCYLESQPPEPWWNYGTYIDTLNPDAVQSFIELTHERYHARFKADFGTTIPTIFMDEPQTTRKEVRERSDSTKDLFLPWTWDLENRFLSEYGTSLIDKIPDLVWDVSSEPSTTRYRYHDLLATMFNEAFNKQISDWCRSAGIMSTGHMNGEPTLTTQTQYLGEAMRCYEHLDMPGIDILCDGREYNTAKQAVSVARQKGAKAVLSELYGVTNWTFDFKGHKAQGDWQAALGITNRVQHLFQYSIAGESKRDYPAAIGYQSPWANEYRYIEDHFARVTSAMTRGRPMTRVGVIHPIESFWLTWGPADRNGTEQVWREHAFQDLTHWLLFGLIDFDFIAESLFEKQSPLDAIGQQMPVGICEYDVIILPNLRTIRNTTLERLQRFAAAGGRVIVMGGMPSLVDLVPKEIELDHEKVPFTRWDMLAALEEQRDLRVTRGGIATDSLFYQMRQDGADRYVYICDVARWDPIKTIVELRGEWAVTVLDTLQGNSWTVESEVLSGWTRIAWTFHACSSLLLRLTARPARPGDTMQLANGSGPRLQPDYEDGINQIGKVRLESVELSEPNVLLLDQATWRLDNGDWQAQLEVLKIDNVVRNRLGLPLKKDAFPQPWSLSASEREPVGTLSLRFDFESSADVDGVRLAIENIENTSVSLDGERVEVAREGWFVDEDIPVIRLGSISAGKHVLQLDIRFSRTTPMERVYLLGDFGVNLYGDKGVMTSLNRDRLSFGDITRQGLPFYAGDIIYHCTLSTTQLQHLLLQVYHFEGPALVVDVNGKRINMSLPPHVADLGEIQAGDHDVTFTVFGNRENAMGALHMPPGETDWWAPNAWRGEQRYWADEYDVKPIGLATAPVIAVPGRREYTVPIRRRHIDQKGMEQRFH